MISILTEEDKERAYYQGIVAAQVIAIANASRQMKLRLVNEQLDREQIVDSFRAVMGEDRSTIGQLLYYLADILDEVREK